MEDTDNVNIYLIFGLAYFVKEVTSAWQQHR